MTTIEAIIACATQLGVDRPWIRIRPPTEQSLWCVDLDDDGDTRMDYEAATLAQATRGLLRALEGQLRQRVDADGAALDLAGHATEDP
jgi:hypothetical protein